MPHIAPDQIKVGSGRDYQNGMQLSAKLKDRETMEAWVDWIDAQPVQNGWRVVTLQYPRWKDIGLWSKAIKHTMRELKQAFLTGALRTGNKATGANHIRRVVALGGDKSTGTALHAHCLIDAIGDEGIFATKLKTAWLNNVRKLTYSDGQPFREREAQVYCRHLEGGPADYVHYIVRNEGNDLKFGVAKIDVPNTYLTPLSSR